MRLKSLTLQGFKSFPVKTSIRFPKGISAIVGPNGCGKSNIVDAFKWVLGEQNPRFLRAKKMSDLLFSGDNGRPTHVAEVRLQIEGKSELLPPELADEPEIEIIRRLYRSGESEYRINGRTCRLKDILYIFMDTGAGSRTYSIVDQGHVGQFVEMGPEERRILVEEVAGISRYKVRRAEAQSRMAKTKENLDRLEDLLAEVQRQWKNLSTQADSTRRYLKLREEQDSLHKTLLAQRWKEGLKTISGLEEEREGLERALKSMKEGIAEKKSLEESLDWEIEELEESLEQVRSAIGEAQERLKDLRSDASDKERRVDRAVSRKGHLDDQISGLMRRAKALRNQYQALSQEMEGLRAQEQAQIKEVSAAEAAVLEVEEMRNEIMAAMEEMKVELVDVSARHARVEGKIRENEERLRRLDSLIEKKGLEREQAQRALESLTEELSRLSNEISSVSNELSAQERSRRETREKLLELEAMQKETRERLSRLKEDFSATKAKFELLHGMETSGQGYSRATKALLASEIPTLGTLADFIEVDEGKEWLVETVLGEMLQAVVLAEGTMVQDALNFLGKKGLRQARIIHTMPLDKAKGELSGPLGSKSLLSFVQGKNPLSTVVQEALSKWLLVEDLSEALCHLKTPEVRQYFFITTQGEILTPWGEVELRGKGEGEVGILKRRAELKRLKALIAEQEENIQDLSAQEKTLRNEAISRHKVLQELNVEINRLRDRFQRIQRERDREEVRAKHLRERRELLGYEMEQLRHERDELQQEAAGLKSSFQEALEEKTRVEASLKGRQEAFSHQEKVLKRRREVLEKNRLELMKIQTTIASREKELHTLKRRQEGVQREIARTRKEKDTLEPNLKGIKEELALAKAKVKAQEEALSRAVYRLEELQDQHREKRHEIGQLREVIEELEEKAQGLQKKIYEIELKLSKVRERLEHLKTDFAQRHQDDLAGNYSRWVQEGFSSGTAERKISRIQKEIDEMGPVNLKALEEFEELDQRLKFLQEQREDLLSSIEDLEKAIKRINTESRERFKKALDKVNEELSQVFPLLFDGGSAELVMEKDVDPLDAGVDYLVRLPGKRIQHLGLLSGGEKAMAALALIFSIFLIKPSPFCLLDEVDAPLDHENTVRFNRLLKKISRMSQVILITHNQKVMEVADTLYGVTMEEKGVSKLMSVDLNIDIKH